MLWATRHWHSNMSFLTTTFRTPPFPSSFDMQPFLVFLHAQTISSYSLWFFSSITHLHIPISFLRQSLHEKYETQNFSSISKCINLQFRNKIPKFSKNNLPLQIIASFPNKTRTPNFKMQCIKSFSSRTPGPHSILNKESNPDIWKH